MARFAYKHKKQQSNFPVSVVLMVLISSIMSACATVPPPPPPVPEVTLEISDINVWLDRMPNAAQRGHAVYKLKLTNTSDSTILVTSLEGYLAPASGGPAFRRFAVTAELESKPVTKIELKPGLTYEFRIKSSAGYEPFDPERYAKVTAGVTLTFKGSPNASAEQTPVPVMITH